MSANDSSSRPQSTRLSYTIAGCSEHSNRYVADNITVDAPTDPNSRWSGQHESPSIKQWILLRLDRLSVIGEFLTRLILDCHSNPAQDSITFGKVRTPPTFYVSPANVPAVYSLALQTWVIDVPIPMMAADPIAQNIHVT